MMMAANDAVAATLLGRGSRPDLDERARAKSQELRDVRAALGALDQQVKAFNERANEQAQGLHTHILRLEGALAQLLELGATKPPEIAFNGAHPAAPILPTPPMEKTDAPQEGNEQTNPQ